MPVAPVLDKEAWKTTNPALRGTFPFPSRAISGNLTEYARRKRGLPREIRTDRMTHAGMQLLSLTYPAELIPGARSAVTTCLRIGAAEKVTLITDRATLPIAAALAAQLAALGCPWSAFVLEDLAPRPLAVMPAQVLADIIVR